MTDSRAKGAAPNTFALHSALAGDTVIVEIAQEKKRYCLHRAVLCHHSKYFQNALNGSNGSWKGSEEGVVSLEDIETESFDLFAGWIYSQQLFTTNDVTLKLWQPLDEADKGEAVLRTFRRYVNALVFGDRFLAYTSKRAVHLRFSTMLTDWGFWVNGSVKVVRYVYENMPSQHPILQQLADDYRMSWVEWEADHGTSPPATEYYYAFTAEEQRKFPVDFHLRVTWGLEQHGFKSQATALMRDQEVWLEKHCCVEHASDEEQRHCMKLHVKYDKRRSYDFYDEKTNE